MTMAAKPYVGRLKRGDLAGVYGHDVRHKGINYEIAYRIYESDVRKLVVILAGT